MQDDGRIFTVWPYIEMMTCIVKVKASVKCLRVSPSTFVPCVVIILITIHSSLRTNISHNGAAGLQKPEKVSVSERSRVKNMFFAADTPPQK